MRKLFVFIAIISLVAVSAGCKKKVTSTGPADAGDAAAVVNGQTITMGELDLAAKSQLQKVQTQIYQIKRRTLDDMIENKLIEEAAAKKGVSVDEYMKEEVDDKVTPPTEKEIKALYDARKGRIKKSYEETKDQIAAFLTANQKARAKRELIARLMKEADIKVELEPPRATVNIDEAPGIGDENAPIVLVEFSDYQCPFCSRVRPTVWRLIDEYKGKIRYVFMDFPLSFHREAKKAHEAAHCAGEQGKYFEYNRKIFNNQKKLKPSDLEDYAKQLNLNMDKFNSCLANETYKDRVADFTKRGMNAGVSGTPAFFINGIMLSGAQPYESFREIIEGELNK